MIILVFTKNTVQLSFGTGVEHFDTSSTAIWEKYRRKLYAALYTVV